ncbi:hypothetical protein ABB37_09528 [Leptomonas pyrrhocoris]|uniref:Uncharacterized protein n=1 Tax=Leptomonas pyrrhocoris TaxID=157538 RepID=A0A0M9FQD4_LEPPY|nr:hypothetical protein ABB37_09528 [Leptomonas pyrrhocoris]XP_015652375.1 hypothetical protein ABB37_09528 [Leptomonas pyrrhocoris]XP_015652376.1 hypothetical protein ABB37_09528 [Leptomonas pyrrhocoris]KPA73935.1 hypothetical protein ABB37_09528 [Leptomonas pyrrhocoris]KPA73936.1 hypothetical protein ABB37_09528 [Leptomonas pyrrhocoris]KPA73937.1 hypothetical protein ABB37_09528 [Leptomonas pyrrhocoris]|eukprot:XP_015652374.1 hypothetical protein ABB37_09528 [Leptomonas pyrrhocoris]
MLRRTSLAQLRVLCLTMLPDGGALTRALRQLGYTPYSLRSSFQQGHASTHPIEWSKLLDGTTQSVPPNLLADYDCVVGPPGAMLYTTLLRQAPQYTKVILVEEVDKDRWAEKYETYMRRLQNATRRASNNRISKAFQNMLAKMVVGGDPSYAASSSLSSATAEKKGASRVAASTEASHSHMTASSGDLRRTFAAEAAVMQGTLSSTTTTESDSIASAKGKENTAEKSNVNGGLQHPRAVALQLYEESVKMSVPPGQLLVYRYGDGWEPLCSFLEKAVPATPFPEYEDGLRVLGNLQERIEFVYALQYVLGGICVVCLLITVVPRCAGVTQFFADLYTDYQVAFGADSDDAVLERETKAEAAAGGRQSDAEKFEKEWRKRGGSVTRTKSG